MNDFFLATNRSITVSEIEVRQIQMKDFDRWVMHAEVIKKFLKNKDHSDEILTELFKAHAVQVISIITCVTDLDSESLFKLALDEQTFKELVKAVLLVNQTYFKYEQPKRGVKKNTQENESTWFDSFQFLVSMGHQHSEIMEMTYGAFQGYVKAANKMYKQGILNSAVASRVAQSDKKGFESFKKEMVSD